jgi:hypothetical protein
MAITDRYEITYEVRPGPYHPREMTNITVSITHPRHGKVGFMNTVKIAREHMGERVHQVLDTEQDEVAQFSTEILDRFGNVRSWLVDGGYRSGTGVWGHELDEGQILYIVVVDIKKEVCICSSSAGRLSPK